MKETESKRLLKNGSNFEDSQTQRQTDAGIHADTISVLGLKLISQDDISQGTFNHLDF